MQAYDQQDRKYIVGQAKEQVIHHRNVNLMVLVVVHIDADHIEVVEDPEREAQAENHHNGD